MSYDAPPQTWASNRNDPTTEDEIITTMERKHGKADRVWVMDGELVSEEHIARPQRSKASYIVGTPKAMLW